MSDQWLDDYVTTALDNQVYRNGIRWFLKSSFGATPNNVGLENYQENAVIWRYQRRNLLPN